MIADLRFPKRVRLVRSGQFRYVRNRGDRLVGRLLVIDFVQNTIDDQRLGVVVSKKFGKSWERIRFKRQVREAFRLNRADLPKGVDLVVRPRSFAKEASSLAIADELTSLFVS